MTTLTLEASDTCSETGLPVSRTVVTRGALVSAGGVGFGSGWDFGSGTGSGSARRADHAEIGACPGLNSLYALAGCAGV